MWRGARIILNNCIPRMSWLQIRVVSFVQPKSFAASFKRNLANQPSLPVPSFGFTILAPTKHCTQSWICLNKWSLPTSFREGNFSKKSDVNKFFHPMWPNLTFFSQESLFEGIELKQLQSYTSLDPNRMHQHRTFHCCQAHQRQYTTKSR